MVLMASLTESGLRTVYEAVLRAEQVRKEGIRGLADLFAEKPRLVISPNNTCASSCLHCVADSNPSGMIMPYDSFVSINPDFFSIFSTADFGRRGNPLLYDSEGHDLADLLSFLHDKGINDFSLALALQKNH